MPKNIYIVMQQGGTSREWHADGYSSLTEARAAIKGHNDASYNTVGPVKVPDCLTKALCSDVRVEEQFYALIQQIAKGVATI